MQHKDRGRIISSYLNTTSGGASALSYRYQYDNYGNRTAKTYYYGSNIIQSYEWERGRLLKNIKNTSGGVVGAYTYDVNGVRYTKTADGVTTTYFYNGNTLLGENRSDGTRLRYFYDATGLCGFSYYNGNETKYYTYVKDVLGNIVMIKDDMGALLARYTYDEWGNCIVNNLEGTIGNINPFRYRGYYYDTESGLYYLMSRYYDPEIGQFISMDMPKYLKPETIGGVDLYAYCNNNPVMYYDPTGHLAGWVIALIYIGAIALTAGTTLGYAAITGEPVVFDVSYTWANFLFPGVNLKVGISAIVDLKDKYIEFYPHLGLSFGLSSGWSFAVGSLENYKEEGDYKGWFFFFGDAWYVGTDFCCDPFSSYDERVSAKSFTIGGSDFSLYLGGDYYWYIPSWTIRW